MYVKDISIYSRTRTTLYIKISRNWNEQKLQKFFLNFIKSLLFPENDYIPEFQCLDSITSLFFENLKMLHFDKLMLSENLQNSRAFPNILK